MSQNDEKTRGKTTDLMSELQLRFRLRIAENSESAKLVSVSDFENYKKEQDESLKHMVNLIQMIYNGINMEIGLKVDKEMEQIRKKMAEMKAKQEKIQIPAQNQQKFNSDVREAIQNMRQEMAEIQKRQKEENENMQKELENLNESLKKEAGSRSKFWGDYSQLKARHNYELNSLRAGFVDSKLKQDGMLKKMKLQLGRNVQKIPPITFKVKASLYARTETFTMSPLSTIYNLKKAIEEKCEWVPQMQRLAFPDHKSLQEVGIKNGSTVYLVVQLYG